jgi:dipeptidyl aminopeptidase/acylaminoacyl peptidase
VLLFVFGRRLTINHLSSTFITLDAYTIVASVVTFGASNIVLLDLKSKTYRDLGLPYSDLALPSTGIFRVSNESFTVLGSTSTSSKHLAHIIDVRSPSLRLLTIRTTTRSPLSEDTVSKAQHLSVPRTSRKGDIHAFLFSPRNPHFEGPPGVPPPGLIHLHGGPNGSTSPALDLTIQFWTSRGYAVCSVNYAGSTGFGRAYREELTGFWGLYDVQDTHDVVRYLDEQGLLDGSRVGIYGGSAGGYGTLSALHMYPDDFTAAVSSYGICDVRALQSNSYKFESHDVERLILSSCLTEDLSSRAEILKQRSPLYFVHKIKAPLLILQGSDDVAVLPEQANMMANEMRRLDRTVKVVEFEGEGHGWLKQDTILRSYLEQESWWKAHLA